MAAERVPEPLNKRKGGGGVVEHLSTAITLVPLIQCQHVYDFLKASKETFQIMCLNPTFRRGPNLAFFGLGPGYPWHYQIGKYFYLSNMNIDGTI